MQGVTHPLRSASRISKPGVDESETSRTIGGDDIESDPLLRLRLLCRRAVRVVMS
jgi:hypothetical protein